MRIGLAEREVGKVRAAVVSAAERRGIEDPQNSDSQGAGVGTGAGQLRQPLALRLIDRARGAADARLGDEHGFVACLGQGERVVEREDARRAGGAGAG